MGADPHLPPDRLAGIDAWLDKLGPSSHLPSAGPALSAERIADAIAHSGRSAPGPDGIPYEAYKRYAPATDILQDAYAFLQSHRSPDFLPPGFNHSRLICFPKKVAGHDENLGDYYTPESTRPLSIVSTDNRLMASASKFALHDFLEKWISDSQQGSLSGRSMIRNILEMDYLWKKYA